MVTEKEKRRVLTAIDEMQPVSHEVLAVAVDLEWDELQERIRALRREGEIVINLNRAYEIA